MSHRAPKLVLILALALVFPATAAAQQVGESINVLPVYRSTPPGTPPGPTDYLRGDLYGQRQDEPSIAVSTLNKDHIIAVYNDFRAVDVPTDPALGTTASALARLWTGVRGWLAKLGSGSRSDRDRGAMGDPDLAANQEAGIGMSVSYDGGLTWIGGFVPGLPFDTTPASLASPAYLAGMQGMSDPVLVAAPCGRFYLAYLAFIRGQTSQLLVSTLQDQNNDDLRHTIRWVRTVLVEQGNNGTYGHFLDKPHIEVGSTGATSCSAVTETVYVSYTTFTGNSTGTKFQSKINMATSTDGGNSFTVAKVDDSYLQNQGTAIVVNPVTNAPYVFWRTFNTPNSIIMSKLTSKGWSKPMDLLANDPLKTIATFDQPTVSTANTSDPTQLAFRSNGFPTAAITPDGSTLLVAWQERVNSSGLPDPSGAPRIVLKYSKDGGSTWSQRSAIATDHVASPPGLGFFNPGFPVGPQVMPSLICGPGSPNRCLLTYYESRPYGASLFLSGGSPIWASRPYGTSPFLSANGWIGGYDRVLDLRALLIDAPASGSPIPDYPSFQVSRYSYRPPLFPGETLGEDYTYVSQICPPGSSFCYPSLNYSGIPHTGGGTMPFMGDYNDAELMVPFIKDATTGVWRAATTAADAPYGAAFIAAWADNRNVIRPLPADPTLDEWAAYGNYSPPGTGGSCINPGSKDQSVMTAQVSLGLLVTAPTNYKPFPSPAPPGTEIEFPMTVWNNTAVDKRFELDIVAGNGSFKKTDPSIKQGFVTIYANSSSAVNVYAFDGLPVTVKVTEVLDDPFGTPAPPASPLTGSITFNSAQAVPPAGTPAPTYAPPSITVTNLITKNLITKNPAPSALITKNPVPSDATVYNITDYSWTVTPSTLGDAATFLSLPNIDAAYQNDYVFQVFVTKPATSFAVNGCDPTNLTHGTLVANVTDPSNLITKNLITKNPVPSDSVTLPQNPSPSDVIAQNASFTLGSSTTVTSGGPLTTTSCDPTTGGGLIGDCTLAAPRSPNQVTITLRAYQITQNPSVIYDPYGVGNGGTLPAANPPSIAVADYWCSGPNQGCNYVQNGPDLVAPASAGVAPATVTAGNTVTFATTAQTVPNAGNQPAGAHQVGFYISAASTVAGLPRAANGTIDTTSTTVYTRLLQTVSMPSLAAGSSETLGPQTLTIPSDIPRPNPDGTGTYYLYAYVDSTRVVSEFNENNNIMQGGPITVLPPAYGFIGLQSPCNVGQLSCNKSGSGAVPIAWQFSLGGLAVDSSANPPRLKFYTGCTTQVTASTPALAVASPDNVSTGNSGFQYFATSGLTRPQWTWQYNWNRTDPVTGANLLGCYQLYIEVPSLGQVIGSTVPGVQPIGPIFITLQ
jgi:CARDB